MPSLPLRPQMLPLPSSPGRRSLRGGWAILTLAGASAFPLATSAPAADGAAVAPLEAGVDAAVRPGDDFFAFANGAWLAGTGIPAGKERVTARTELDDLTRRQVAQLLDDASAAPAGSAARMVADFRAAYLDEATIEKRALTPLAARLAQVDAIGDRAALVRLLGADLGADVDPLNWGVYDSSRLLGLAVEMGNHGEKDYVAFLLQGGLGLPDREAYLSGEASATALRDEYRAYIGRLLALAGLDHDPRAPERAAAVLALETAIAQSHAPRDVSANDHNADNLWTRADFARRAPGIDWLALFAAGGLARQESFVVWQPSAIEGAAALVASQPLAVWQDYLRFHELDRRADILPKVFADAALAMREAAAGATDGTERPSRAERARTATLTALRDEVGRTYTERFFPAEAKARVEAIVADVVAAFHRRVESVAWLSPASRTLAIAKLNRVYFGVGYPERRVETSDLVIDPADAVGNFDRVAARESRRLLAKLGRPVDRMEWWMTPQTVGAVLLFQPLAYNFPAAILQAPKFDPAASDAANYGAIGAIVGHEVSHTVDTLGAEYDADGANRHWWTPADLAGYTAATAPLVEQFSAYRPFPDLAVDGRRTLSENLADLGGLCAAFDAYRKTLGARAADPALVRRLDREFFIGFARSWRSRYSPEALRKQVAGSDSHAPDVFRIATVRNLDAWYAAFDVQPGDRLYLPPERRVHFW